MGERGLRPCAEPGCTSLVRGGRCQRHARAPEKEWDSLRPGPDQRGYGRAWRFGIRPRHLKREPLCRRCRAAGRLTPAQEVDHIVPLAEGGTNESANLQSLCKPCHSKKGLDDRARRRGGRR